MILYGTNNNYKITNNNMNQNEFIAKEFLATRENRQRIIDQNIKLIEYYKAKIEELEVANEAEQRQIDILDKHLEGDFKQSTKTPDITAPASLIKTSGLTAQATQPIAVTDNILHINANYTEAILKVLTYAVKPISVNTIIKRVFNDGKVPVKQNITEIFTRSLNKLIKQGKVGVNNPDGVFAEYFYIKKLRETTVKKYEGIKNCIFDILVTEPEGLGITKIIELLVDRFNYSKHINKEVYMILSNLIDDNIIEHASNNTSKHKKYRLVN